jgi:WD40 repeat protein
MERKIKYLTSALFLFTFFTLNFDNVKATQTEKTRFLLASKDSNDDFDLSILDFECCPPNPDTKIEPQSVDFTKDQLSQTNTFPIKALNGSRFVSWADKSVYALKSGTFELITEIKTSHSQSLIDVAPIPNDLNNLNLIDRIVTASKDFTCQVWELWTGKLVTTFKQHTSAPTLLTPLDDGIHIISVAYSTSNEILLWDTKTGLLVQDMSSLSPGLPEIKLITLKRWNGNLYVVVGGTDDLIYQFKSDDLNKIQFSFDDKLLNTKKGDILLLNWIASTGGESLNPVAFNDAGRGNMIIYSLSMKENR